MPICPGCRAQVPKSNGPTHKYFGEHPGCWKLFGEVLAREFESREYWSVHRLTVDSYAAQHPRNKDRRNIQSVNIHLMALYAIVEEGQAFEKIPALLSKAAGHFKSEFQYLDPPSIIGDITVSDIHKARTAADHCAIVVNWSKSVWKSWSAHHTKIATLYQNTVELL